MSTIQQEGSIGWECPSNIALVKYWGKTGIQLPKNPSLSFTLKKSKTQTRLHYKRHDKNTFTLTVSLDGKPAIDFQKRIIRYFKMLEEILPFINNYAYSIETSNTFPHSAGIASSASGMGALALALCTLEEIVTSKNRSPAAFFEKASYLARMGSGSASRSVYGGYTIWGKTKGAEEYSDLYAVPVSTSVDSIFYTLRDAVLIVDPGTKSVSSSTGHALMENHPYAQGRIKQATENIKKLMEALKKGNKEAFSEIVEQEALSLHALMMSSERSFILLKPATLEIINVIRKFREKTGIFVCFTIDAGPNVHMLYLEDDRNTILPWLKQELLQHCYQNTWIDDAVGEGPLKTN